MKKRAVDGWQMDMPAGCQGKQRTSFSLSRRKRRFLASKDSFYKEFTVVCWKVQYLWVNISV